MVSTFDGSPPTRRGTALPRALALALLAGVILATLYPLSDWRLRTAGAFAFLREGLPRYWTGFDVASNLLAYAVLALMLTVAWPRRSSPWAGLAVVTVGASLLSLSLEAVQSYLPGRVPSLLDWLANTAGAALGAGLGTALGRLGGHGGGPPGAAPGSPQWYEQGPATGWVLLGVWLATLIVPQRLLFATGEVMPLLQRLLARWAPDAAIDLSTATQSLWGGVTPIGFGIAVEAGTVVCAICSVGALVFTLVDGPRRRVMLLVAVGIAAFGLRSIATQAVYGPSAPFAWLTPGAQGGLLVGAVLLYGLETLGARLRAWAAILATVVGVALVNLAPESPYFDTMVAYRVAGPLANLNGLLSVASTLWPALAVGWLWRHSRDGVRRR